MIVKRQYESLGQPRTDGSDPITDAVYPLRDSKSWEKINDPVGDESQDNQAKGFLAC